MLQNLSFIVSVLAIDLYSDRGSYEQPCSQAPTQVFHKFPLTELCVIAADRVVCWTVLVSTLFAPTQGLHFQAPPQIFHIQYAAKLGKQG